MNILNCIGNLPNLSKSLCKGDYGQILKVWFFKNNKTISLTDALLEATWANHINAAPSDRMYILNDNPIDATWEFGDAAIVEGNTGLRKKASDGTQRLLLVYGNIPFCKKEEIKKLDGLTLYSLFVTSNEAILGSGDSTNLETIETQFFIDEIRPQENSQELWRLNCHIDIIPRNNIWINAIAPYESNSWRPSLKDGISNIIFSNISADISDKEVIFDASTYCDDIDVTSLTTATDFIVEVASTEIPLTIDSVTVSGNQYTLTINTGTPLTAVLHNLRLKNQPTMTVKGYESETFTFTPVP